MSNTIITSPYPIQTKLVPTFYFVGVTTGSSSIMKVFPRWVEVLGHPDVVIEGIDHVLRDTPDAYCRTVAQIKYDPRSLGALVTSHKVSLAEAARHMFDELDPYAQITGEISCIAKRDGRLIGYAKDPITGGISLDAVLGAEYFARTQGDVLCFGAGGSGVAISLHLINKKSPGDRPRRMIVTNRSQERLDKLQAIVAQLDTDIAFELICNSDPARNDAIMAAMPEGSVVINASGLGKDAPGSPITDAGKFPRNGVAWELNYRGELDFWHQAMGQQESRALTIEDGWLYFVHGWTAHVAEVLNIKLDQPLFERLAQVAAELRPPLVYCPRT